MTDQTEIELVARAIGDSEAYDDEGRVGRLFDQLDYSGENNARIVLREAARMAIAALDAHRSASLPDEVREVVERLRITGPTERKAASMIEALSAEVERLKALANRLMQPRTCEDGWHYAGDATHQCPSYAAEHAARVKAEARADLYMRRDIEASAQCVRAEERAEKAEAECQMWRRRAENAGDDVEQLRCWLID